MRSNFPKVGRGLAEYVMLTHCSLQVTRANRVIQPPAQDTRNPYPWSEVPGDPACAQWAPVIKERAVHPGQEKPLSRYLSPCDQDLVPHHRYPQCHQRWLGWSTLDRSASTPKAVSTPSEQVKKIQFKILTCLSWRVTVSYFVTYVTWWELRLCSSLLYASSRENVKSHFRVVWCWT
jgi:hypothetical protein